MQDHQILVQKFETVNKLNIDKNFEDKFGAFFSSSETRLWLLSGDELLYRNQEIPLPDISSAFVKDTHLEWSYGKEHLRGRVFQLDNHPDTYAVIAININHHYTYLRSFGNVLIIVTIIASLINGFLGWAIVKRELEPMDRLELHVREISTNQLDIRIPPHNFPKELLPFVEGFNDMLDKLEGDFKRLSEFSSDIAHELRTPIGNMMTQTHVALSKLRTTEEYQDVLVSSSEELNRLGKTISDMLYLAKSEHNLLLKTIEPFELNTLSSDLIEYFELAGEDKQLSFQLHGNAHISGDKSMIKRAIGNLLSNAVRHSNENSIVKIDIQQFKTHAELSVTNLGDTVAEESIPHIFERFYRADKSRVHSSSSGSGLGLPITRSIAQLHNGDVSVVSVDGETIFTLNIGQVDT